MLVLPTVKPSSASQHARRRTTLASDPPESGQGVLLSTSVGGKTSKVVGRAQTPRVDLILKPPRLCREPFEVRGELSGKGLSSL